MRSSPGQFMRRRLMPTWTRTVPAAVLAVAILAARADGGPARYDRETKSFDMAYTFVNLDPSVPGTFQAGPPQRPSEAQDAAVRALINGASAILEQITQGRGRIGRLDYVDDPKKADF